MAATERWYFTKEQLNNSPSRSCGIDTDKELSYRQQAANLIQDMGQRLQVTQLCINTAIVYMHRFYVFHSFAKFHRNAISTCALFLAAKVEEQPRKLEHVIKISHLCLDRNKPSLDTKSEIYMEEAHDIVINENIMLQTLGFDIAIDHPHTYVVKCCQLVRASKDLAQTSYFMATNSLHLTTMCLQYKPTLVACVCIHLACKWSNWEIPLSSEGKEWFWYVDRSVTIEQLEELTSEFLAILDKCPSRLKRKIMSGSSKEGQTAADKKAKGDANTSASTTNSSLSAAEQNMDLENFLESKEFLDSQQEAMSGHIQSEKFSPGNESFDYRNSSGNLSALNHLSPRSCGVFSEPSTVSPSKKKLDPGHPSISLAVYRDRETKDRKDTKRRPTDGSHTKPTKDYHEKPEVHNTHSNAIVKSQQKPPEDSRIVHHHERGTKVRHPQQPSKNSDKLQTERGSKAMPLNSGSIVQHRGEQQKNDTHSEHSFSNDSGIVISSSEAKFQKMYYDTQQPSIETVLPVTGIKNEYGRQFSDIVNEDIKIGDSINMETDSYPEDKYLNIIKPKEETAVMPPVSQSTVNSGNLGPSMSKSPVIATKSPGTKSRPKHSKRKSPVVASEGPPAMHSVPAEPQHNTAQAVAQPIPEKKSSHRKKSPLKDRSHLSRTETEDTRHERREKHKQLPPNRSSQELVSSGIVSAPPSGGLKITIPKDKIMLGSIKNSDNASQPKSDLTLGASSPPREALKIKIPKVKLSVSDNAKQGTSVNAGKISSNSAKASSNSGKSENTQVSDSSSASSNVNTNQMNASSSVGLKIVITKDRLNSGTYSTSVAQKPEKESRKRERYSKDNAALPAAAPPSTVTKQEDQNTDNLQPASKIPRSSSSASGRGRGRRSHQQQQPPPISEKNGRKQGQQQQQHYAASNGKADNYNNAYHQPAKRGRGGRPPHGQFNMMPPYGRPDFFTPQQQYFPYSGPPMGPPMYHHPPSQPMPQVLFSNPPPPPPPLLQAGRPPLPSEPPPRPPPLPPGDR